ncbi:MAG: hypothetical protein RLZZ440_633 [Planctomycetota bacterium]
MPRPARNPFYALLGIVGFLFTITAAAYCVSVLRGIRPETARSGGGHALERLMDEHGTTVLVAEIALLAVATVGAIWLDHLEGERVRRRRLAERAAATDSGVDEP